MLLLLLLQLRSEAGDRDVTLLNSSTPTASPRHSGDWTDECDGDDDDAATS